jgi:hypothetical protein
MSLVLVERIVHRYNVNTASSSLPRVSADMLQDIKDIIVGGPNNPRFRERPWMLEVSPLTQLCMCHRMLTQRCCACTTNSTVLHNNSAGAKSSVPILLVLC